jgi:hypothetical protein
MSLLSDFYEVNEIDGDPIPDSINSINELTYGFKPQKSQLLLNFYFK